MRVVNEVDQAGSLAENGGALRDAGLCTASSKQLCKLVRAQSCLSNDCSERAFVKLSVIRYDQLPEGIITAQNHVASLLAFEVVADLGQSLYTLASRNTR